MTLRARHLQCRPTRDRVSAESDRPTHNVRARCEDGQRSRTQTEQRFNDERETLRMSGRGELDPGAGLSLAQLIAQIDTRLEALRPLVREFEQLESARAVLVGDHGGGAGRARRSPRPPAASPARGRRAPRGANRAAILRLAGERPGITVAEIAQVAGIGKPTVHSTVYALTRRGELERAGDGVKLVGGSSEPAARAARRAAPARRHAARRRAARARAARRTAARRTPARAVPAEAVPPAADGAPDVPPAEADTNAGAE